MATREKGVNGPGRSSLRLEEGVVELQHRGAVEGSPPCPLHHTPCTPELPRARCTPMPRPTLGDSSLVVWDGARNLYFFKAHQVQPEL